MRKLKPIQYIMIAMANAYGHDKETWERRLQWAHAFINSEFRDSHIENALEPILLRKAVRAYEDALNGVPTGYVMSLDATASGLQIYACLIGCHKTAANVNLIDTGKREDAYQKLADTMSKASGVHYSRADLKKPTMTVFYGATAAPAKLFSEEQLAYYYKALRAEFTGAMELLFDIQSCWTSAEVHSWTLPDGHVAYVPVTEMVNKKIEIAELGKSCFQYQSEVIAAQEWGLSLAANIIHSVDGYVIREMTRYADRQGFELLHIHDCFLASPNHMQKVRENYVQILAEICDMDLLASILSDIKGTKITIKKYTNNLADLVLKSDYALS